MTHEKLIKRDATQYKIVVNLMFTNYLKTQYEYRVDVYYREKGKKSWLPLPDTLHDYQIRSLSPEDREKHRIDNTLRFISAEELLQAKLELWQSIKPQ